MRFTSSKVCVTLPTVELDPWRPGGLEGDRSVDINACHSCLEGVGVVIMIAAYLTLGLLYLVHMCTYSVV